MDIPIVFEDTSMFVVNKPFGLVVNRAETTTNFETLQDWIDSRQTRIHKVSASKKTEMLSDETDSSRARMTIEEEFESRSGIVHRLDKDTSGVLVIAKTPQAFENLKNQFKDRKTVKKYLALVHGKVAPPTGKIDAPIERSPFNRMHFGIFPGGREAQTIYRTVKNYELGSKNQGQNALTLLEVEPKTGRTHQIRVHLKHLNHPIVSDPIYGGRKQIREDLKWCPRLFLHAASLEIAHPISGKGMKFEAEMPTELKNVIEFLL